MSSASKRKTPKRKRKDEDYEEQAPSAKRRGMVSWVDIIAKFKSAGEEIHKLQKTFEATRKARKACAEAGLGSQIDKVFAIEEHTDTDEKALVKIGKIFQKCESILSMFSDTGDIKTSNAFLGLDAKSILNIIIKERKVEEEVEDDKEEVAEEGEESS